MKKLCLFLCVLLTLALFGCEKAPAEQTVPTTAPVETTAPIETTPPTTLPPETEPPTTEVPPETTEAGFVPDYSKGFSDRFRLFIRNKEMHEEEWHIKFLADYGIDFLQYPIDSAYILDMQEKNFIFLCDDPIVEVSGTPNALLLSTKDGRVILSDYLVTHWEVLYTSELSQIIHSNRYLTQMCIVEPSRIVLLDLLTKEYKTVLEEEGIQCAFMYLENQLFWSKDKYNYYLLDCETGTNQPLSELDMNEMIFKRG